MQVIIADPDPVFAKEISAELALVKEVEIIGCENSWEGANRSVRDDRPQLVVFGPGWAGARVIAAFRTWRQENPRLGGIMVTSEYTTDLRRQAAEAGFAGVYGIPLDGSELLMCLRRIAAGAVGKAAPKKNEKGRVVTVFSTKGGVGKSVIATNLAVLLSRDRGAKSIVVDLDLQFGDVAVMLKLLPKHTLYDLVGLKSIDLGQLTGFLSPFNDKVSAFAAPLQPELADLITPEIIKPVFGWLRRAADFIVIDTPPCFNDNVLGVLDETDELYLVATLDLPSLKNIKLCLQTLQLLDFPKEKIKLVLNRVEKNLGLSVSEVEEIFQEKVSAQIPNDPAVALAVNKGSPVVEDAVKSPAAKILETLAAGIAGKRRKQEVA